MEWVVGTAYAVATDCRWMEEGYPRQDRIEIRVGSSQLKDTATTLDELEQGSEANEGAVELWKKIWHCLDALGLKADESAKPIRQELRLVTNSGVRAPWRKAPDPPRTRAKPSSSRPAPSSSGDGESEEPRRKEQKFIVCGHEGRRGARVSPGILPGTPTPPPEDYPPEVEMVVPYDGPGSGAAFVPPSLGSMKLGHRGAA